MLVRDASITENEIKKALRGSAGIDGTHVLDRERAVFRKARRRCKLRIRHRPGVALVLHEAVHDGDSVSGPFRRRTTSSRNRITVAASVRLCAGAKFCRNKSCATLMASTIVRSELMRDTQLLAFQLRAE